MLNIQATGNLYGETVTIKQVSKVAAKKLFAAGETVYLQSSNMRPFSVWQSVCPIKFCGYDKQSSIDFNFKYPDSPIRDESYQFEQIVKEYRCYNCDGERGKYVHFYKKVS